jgi:TatD DNase family protein
MILVDTHSHLDFPQFDKDRDAAIDRAKKAGVGYIINVGSSVEASQRSLALAEAHSHIFASAGIHPHYAKEANGVVPEPVRSLLDKEKVVAVGEVGLDYYRNLSEPPVQKALFGEFIRLAKEKALPLIVHTREAHDDTIAVLKENSGDKISGVVHCFSGGKKELDQYLKLGLYVSFTCNLTFKNAGALREVAAMAPPERLLLETDAPYMAPQEKRGERNEPSYVTYLLKILSEIHGHSIEDIARITTHNAKSLFDLPIPEEPKIAYPIRDSLYLNITNRCTNACGFCVRAMKDFVKGHKLKLDHEPGKDEIISAMGDVSGYKEIVFCGYGEPTLRLDLVKEVAGYLKKKGARVRMVTNGEGNLINKRPVGKELAGLIDRVSISINVDSSDNFDRMCRSEFGPGTFNKVKEFARECRDAGIEVEVTFLDLPGVDKDACEEMAKEDLKVKFRMRRLNIVG